MYGCRIDWRLDASDFASEGRGWLRMVLSLVIAMEIIVVINHLVYRPPDQFDLIYDSQKLEK